MDFEAKLQSYMEEHNIEAEHIPCENCVKDSGQASIRMGISPDKVLKTILFFDENKQLYAVMLRGSDRVHTKKIKQHFGIKDAKMVPFDDVVEICGYPAGGVPPFGFEAIFVLDESFEDEEVYAGGGSTHSLVKAHISQIIKADNPVRLKVTKDSK